MKYEISIACAVFIVAMIGTVGTAESTITNGGFETGLTPGWTYDLPVSGVAAATTTHTGVYMTYSPVEGQYFLALKGGSPDEFSTASQETAPQAGLRLSNRS